MSDQSPRIITRRELLKGVGAVGVATAAPVGFDSTVANAAAEPAQASTAPVARGALEALTASEFDTLEAIVARIVPSDANGRGAREARAAYYIDRALGGALAGSRETYRAGLAALDRYSQSSRGKPFHELSPTDQDSVLIDVELGAATGFAGGSAP